jgi:hypothetical protein
MIRLALLHTCILVPTAYIVVGVVILMWGPM